VAKVIIGTGIIRDEAFVKKVIEVFGDKVIGGVDVRSGKACIEGWMKTTETPLEEVVARIVALGIGEVVYTDVTRDGTLKGPHFESILRFSRLFKGSIIISGGISSVEDVRKLRRMEQYGVKGVIIGRALYAGTIKLSEAIKAGMKGCH
jgi:phosphoribosylformimino-5-aminoimidazole carboxamide ribotide isomerase